MQLDPVYALTIRLGFVLLFSGALVHKVAGWLSFESTVSKYLAGLGVSRRSIVKPVAISVAVTEIGVLASCVLQPGGSMAVAVSGLLVAYGTVMFINLVQGNVLLDCGCSWGSTRQPISYSLVVRNVVLALLALPLLLPVASRPLGALDMISAGAAAATVAVLYGALNLLLTFSRPTLVESR